MTGGSGTVAAATSRMSTTMTGPWWWPQTRKLHWAAEFVEERVRIAPARIATDSD
jgi:hypothetical protein